LEVSAVRISKTVPVLMLLFVVTTGLFTMHTLGHFGAPESMPMPGGYLTMVMQPDHAAPIAVSGHEDNPAIPMGSMVACVAILAGLLLLAVAVLLGRRARGRLFVTMDPLGRIVDAVRGPPKIRPGLALACLSVSRN
jgi:hypothetical protein